MEKGLMYSAILCFLFILSSCTQETTNEADIELNDIPVSLSVTLNTFGFNTENVYVATSEDVTIDDNFQLKEVILLTNDYGEFPYVTETVTTDLDEYVLLISNMVSELSGSSLSSSNWLNTGPKEKVNMTIENSEYMVSFKFYQCEDNTICGSSITITNINGTYNFYEVDSILSKYYDDIDSLIE